MKIIIVPDVTDVRKVAAALQEAADEVLNARSLRELIKDKYNHQSYQYIHPSRTSSAVGGVSIIVGGAGEQRDMTVVYVTLKRPGGYNKEPAGYYVPTTVIRRLRVRLGGGRALYQPRKFSLDSSNSEARAALTLPTQTFKRHPKVLIEIV